MILVIPFLIWSFMAVMDEKDNMYKVFCYDDKGKPLYMGETHITQFPKLVEKYGSCSLLDNK